MDILTNTKQYGGIVDLYIMNSLYKLLFNYIGISNGIKPKEFLNSLGGIYFIEGESKYEKEDHYKIGMAEISLIERVKSYGTYFPFGIRINGLSFTNKSFEVNEKSKLVVDIKKIVNNLTSENYDMYCKVVETSREIENNISYFTKKGACDIYNKDKTVFDVVYNVAIATLEDALHYRLFIKNPESKIFETKIQSRKNYGEFFKMKKDDILKDYLATVKSDNQILLYFPDKPLIFGQNLKSINDEIVVHIYRNNKKIDEKILFKSK